MNMEEAPQAPTTQRTTKRRGRPPKAPVALLSASPMIAPVAATVVAKTPKFAQLNIPGAPSVAAAMPAATSPPRIPIGDANADDRRSVVFGMDAEEPKVRRSSQRTTVKRRGRPPKSVAPLPEPEPVPLASPPAPSAPPSVRIISEKEADELAKSPPPPPGPMDPPLGSPENPIPLTQKQFEDSVRELREEIIQQDNAEVAAPELETTTPKELGPIKLPPLPEPAGEPALLPDSTEAPKPTEPVPEPEPTVLVPATEESRSEFLGKTVDQTIVPPLVNQEKQRTPVPVVDKDQIGDFKIPKQALYPSLDDPEFNLKIANRKEFQDSRFLAPVADIEKEQNARCQSEFEILPHQSFIKNFLSMQTPYNSLLVYHALGSGKTCSAIGVAEEMRNYIKQVGLQKRILILAQPNVLDNFRLQLFDESRLKIVDGEWNIQSCVGKAILDEINPTELKTTSRQRLVQNVQAILRTFYEFKGYVKFANDVANAIQAYPANDSRRIRKIQAMYDNTLIIIDEVHNVRLTSDNDTNMTTANYLYLIAKHARNVRFVLLSATPMYNSHKEIIWLTNLMNVNDHRGEITADQVFDKEGNFRTSSENPAAPIVGRELLKRKLTGYVSYVRGENPYTFPFRIYESNKKDYDLDLDQEKDATTPQYPPIYISKLEETQGKTYQSILNSVRDVLAQRVKSTAPSTDATEPEDAAHIVARSLETLDNIGYEQLQLPIQALNIVYGAPEALTAAEEVLVSAPPAPQNYVGSTGLRTILQDMKNGQFEYKPDVPHVFEPTQIANYSKKIATILDKIQTAEKGIVLIYSEFLDAGVIPVALALEEAGFSRFPGTRTAGGEPNRSLFLKTTPQPKKYAMITGSAVYSPNNKDELRALTSESNKNGDQIQVVLITRAGAEGIDFKNIRQIHIMEPWYNMSRIEQIIGRGVRNGSHCSLPFEDRNVEIYMHATQTKEGTPSADMYLYEFAFKKAKRIGRVSRLLKQIAVDCILNKEQHDNFTPESLSQIPENQEIQIRTAHGQSTIKPGDQPHTAVCDYMDSCKMLCEPDQDEDDANAPLNMMTYDMNYLTTNQTKILQHIRQLFSVQAFYPIDVLIQKIQEKSHTVKYSAEQIYYCLTYLIQNRNREYLYDKNGRRGYLINRGEIYAFQPVEITDETISVFERTFPILFRPSKLTLDVSPKFRTNEVSGLKAPMEGPSVPASASAPVPPSLPRKIAKSVAPKAPPKTPLPPESPIKQSMRPLPSAPSAPLRGEAAQAAEISHELTSRYHVLLQQIQYNLSMIRDVMNREEATMAIPASKHTDYTFTGMIFAILVERFHLHEDQIMHYMTDHIIDAMPLNDKLILAKHILLDQEDANPDDRRSVGFGRDAEEPKVRRSSAIKAPVWVREYFEHRNYHDGKYLMLTNEQNNVQVYVKSGAVAGAGGPEWILGKPTDEIYMKRHYIDPIKQNYTPYQTKVARMVGFYVADDSKNPNTEFVFKVKDFTKETKSRNAKGENLKKAGKRRVIELLNILFDYMGVELRPDIESKEFNHGMLSMMVEILLRHNRANGRGIYYLTPEEYAILKF